MLYIIYEWTLSNKNIIFVHLLWFLWQNSQAFFTSWLLSCLKGDFDPECRSDKRSSIMKLQYMYLYFKQKNKGLTRQLKLTTEENLGRCQKKHERDRTVAWKWVETPGLNTGWEQVRAWQVLWQEQELIEEEREIAHRKHKEPMYK